MGQHQSPGRDWEKSLPGADTHRKGAQVVHTVCLNQDLPVCPAPPSHLQAQFPAPCPGLAVSIYFLARGPCPSQALTSPTGLWVPLQARSSGRRSSPPGRTDTGPELICSLQTKHCNSTREDPALRKHSPVSRHRPVQPAQTQASLGQRINLHPLSLHHRGQVPAFAREPSGQSASPEGWRGAGRGGR